MDHSNDQGKVMRPHLDILPEPQRHLWPRLSAVPNEFVLYGGTAIALQLGHRQSLDFDFFSFSHFCTDDLSQRVPFLADARVIQQAPNTLSVLVPSRADGNDVKVSFFGVPRLRALKTPHRMADNDVRVAHLLDLAGMKMAALPRRVEAKDYIDLHAIMSQTDISLEHALAAAKCIYGNQFNPYDTLKALVWFDHPELATVTKAMRHDLERCVARFDPARFRKWQRALCHILEKDDDD